MKNIFSLKYTVIEDARKTGRGNVLVIELIKAIFTFFVMICITGILSDIACALILKNGDRQSLATIIILYCEIFGIGTGILYCTVFERRSVQSIGFRKPVIKPYVAGLFLGALLISAVVLIGTIFGGFRFFNVNTNVNLLFQLLLFGGYLVQGMSEEVLCRGYLFVSMARKNGILAASLGSSLVFGLMHVFNEGFSFLPLLNLVFFGLLESLIFLKTNSIWTAGAVHSIWNYMQGGVFGLSVSGNDLSDSFLIFEQTDRTYINGGTFGPEGSIIVTVVLLAAIIVQVFSLKRDAGNNH